nr:MAG TPA: hypothetical protein [Caudoviricetes sp.]
MFLTRQTVVYYYLYNKNMTEFVKNKSAGGGLKYGLYFI